MSTRRNNYWFLNVPLKIRACAHIIVIQGSIEALVRLECQRFTMQCSRPGNALLLGAPCLSCLLVRDLGGLGVGEMPRSYWCHGMLVVSPQLIKHTVCQVRADAKVPRGGLKDNFPHRTLNRVKSFLLSFLRHWSRFFLFFIWGNSWIEYVDKFREILIGKYDFEKK